MILRADHLSLAELLSFWRGRKRRLERELARQPDDEWAWLLAIRHRVCTYLLRRYGSGPAPETRAEPAEAETPTAISGSADLEPFETTVSGPADWGAVDTAGAQRRRELTAHYHDVLSRCGVVGERVRAAAEAERATSEARMRRYDTTAVGATEVLLWVTAIASMMLLSGGVALCLVRFIAPFEDPAALRLALVGVGGGILAISVCSLLLARRSLGNGARRRG